MDNFGGHFTLIVSLLLCGYLRNSAVRAGARASLRDILRRRVGGKTKMNSIPVRRRLSRWLAACVTLLLVAGVAWAGQRKGKEKKPAESQTPVPVHVPDNQLIDQEISEMMGAWQLGDINMLHNYYADNVTVVSGAYESPLMGWQSYATAYELQRKRMGPLRLDRRNTNIFVHGDIAWANYQWEFTAIVDGKPLGAHGHTTLVFERRGDRWLIVHDHTSQVCEAAAPPEEPKPGS
jgi:ketosteroid isomerase-like protein